MLTPILLMAALGLTPNDQQLDLLKTFRREFVLVTPGEGAFPRTFVQGRAHGGRENERPAHQVSLNASFLIGKYEVPQDLWEAVMGQNPSRWKGARNSVEMISFDEAEEFCQKATTLMREARLIGQNQRIRLPSESEWEYVARAGTGSSYSFGDRRDQLADYAWFQENAAGNDPPVGAKKPNAWGLYDIHGYLWEWTADPAHDSYVGAPADGSVWSADSASKLRVLRGGSWKDSADRLTSSYRRTAERDLRDDAVGLRCVLSSD